MKSTMTEKAFMHLVADGLKARGYSFSQAAKDSIREAAEAAGLEFAPEPVKLPERIEPVFNVQWLLMVRLPPAKFGPAHRFLSDVEAFAAAARYNAYPGLREKAEALVSFMRDLMGRSSLHGKPEKYSAALEAELAKGPK